MTQVSFITLMGFWCMWLKVAVPNVSRNLSKWESTSTNTNVKVIAVNNHFFLVNILKNPACVEIILEHSAEVNALNKVDRNVLHVAIIDKAPIATVELLLKRGIDVNQKDTHGSTSLLYASTTTTDCVRLLLEHGADTNLSNQLGQSPLMLSIRPPNRKRTHCDIPKLLLNAGADVNAKDKFQRRPLHYSSSYKNADVAALFIDRGANINCVDESNQTPLMFSIFYTDDRDSDACHRVLLKHDCDINIIDILGNSALHHAARCGRTQLLEELCQRGADINLKSEKGFTPLISSIQEGKINCMKILLRFGSELKSLQRHSNEIHQSIMQHGLRQNNTARMENNVHTTSCCRVTYQLPTTMRCTVPGNEEDDFSTKSYALLTSCCKKKFGQAQPTHESIHIC